MDAIDMNLLSYANHVLLLFSCKALEYWSKKVNLKKIYKYSKL